MKQMMIGAFMACLAGSLFAESVTATAVPTTVQLKDGSEVTVQATYDVTVKAQKRAELPPRQVALIVENRTGETALDGACRVMAAQVGAQVAGAEVEILDPDTSVFAIAPRRETREDGTLLPTQKERLQGDTSPLRLAEQMGADYLLTISLDRFTKNTHRIKDRRFGTAADGSGASIINEVFKISGSYRVSDVYSGSAFDGGTVKVQTTIRKTATSETELGTFADGLEEDLAAKLAQIIREKASTWREAAMAKSGVPVSFTVLAYDRANQPIYLPVMDADGVVRDGQVPVEVAATVEVDGIARGASGNTIRLSRGLHTVRFSHAGYEDLTMVMVPSEGLNLTVNLRMTDEHYARVKDSIAFMHNLSIEREQSQAAVAERLGHAKMLEQSGFQIKADRLPEVMGAPVWVDWVKR